MLGAFIMPASLSAVIHQKTYIAKGFNPKMTETREYRSLRDAFGQFATGVTVVTARDSEGKPIGLTANSFASVSLDPPLVSWCIDKQSARFELLAAAEFYTISVLTEQQRELSNLFAMRSWDDNAFNEVQWYEGLNGVPQLPDVGARFHCKSMYKYPGGDHLIIVGAVEDYEFDSQSPLIFFQGDYQVINAEPLKEESVA
ncbi:MAG: flavin reductase (DIM6/NTAB) family NADH-FMN oxidoreductase RutF [Arenicella sp.]|jgi:flavin reductase (DIM6/NTAB) family NADH-FMN oxidoreductase RutF